MPSIPLSPPTVAAAASLSQNSERNNSSKSLSLIAWLLEITFLVLPLFILITSIVMQEFYHGPLSTYIDSFRINHEGSDASGLYYSLDDDVTYYNRQCTAEDITTLNIENKTSRSDLLILPDQVTPQEAQEVMMTHGAVMLQNVLTEETATNLRAYLESRHDAHTRDELGWQEKFWSDISRLSLGLGFHDHPSIPQALHEIGTNPQIKNTLEGIFGTPDAAVVEISTLTCLFGAPDQGLHTDSDYFGSSLLYSRTFLHSYTMFIALQDTTSRMGATTVCPGTHWCANEDMIEFCQAHHTDEDDEIENYDLNEAFDVSSNGITGKASGVLRKGDAMMFNQNIFHRGPRNDDPDKKDTNRVMFIVTFVNQRDFEKYGDVRQQGMGTYYYMRWNMWGHRFSDFKHALSNASRLWKQPWAIMKAVGVLVSDMAVPWTEHWARQFANQMDFYDPYELPDFKAYLETETPTVFQKFFKHLHKNTAEYDWHEFVPQLLGNLVESAKIVYGVGLLVSSTFGLVLYRKKWLVRTLIWHVCFAAVGYGLLNGLETHSFLGQKIASGEIHTSTFLQHDSIPLKTTLPDRMDFLVGTRFDSDYLGSYNHVLDYHPGNVHLTNIVHDLATDAVLPLEIITSIIWNTWQWKDSTDTPPRMLLQDPGTGYWIVLTTAEAIEALKKLIVKSQNTLLDNMDTLLLQVLADSRFGRRRDTAMAKRFDTQFVRDWQKVLFSEFLDTDGEKLPLPTYGGASTILLRPIMPLAKLTTVLSSSSTKMPSRLLLQDEYSGSIRVGSRVWAVSADAEGRWESAKVLSFPSHKDVRIVYSSDGVTERIVSSQLVQPFSHIVQGDSIQVFDEERGTWQNGKIQNVSPLGFYAIHLQDGSTMERVLSRDVRFAPMPLDRGQEVWAQVINDDGLESVGFWERALIIDLPGNEDDDNGWVEVAYQGKNMKTVQRISKMDTQPYFCIEQGDTIEILLDDDDWWEGEVTDIYMDDDGEALFNVYVEEKGQHVEDIEANWIRPLPPLISVQTRVMADFGGNGDWFSGTVAKYHAESRSYHIEYDDGDYEEFVWRDRIHISHHSAGSIKDQ